MIRRRWFNWGYVFPAVILVILEIAFMPFYTVEVIKQGSWEFLVVLIPWVLYVDYYMLTKLLNSSYLLITPGCIDVSHKPLFYTAGISISTTEIAYIQLEEKRYAGRSRRKYYELMVLTKTDTKQKLLSDIDSKQQALFIKGEIDRFLKLSATAT